MTIKMMLAFHGADADHHELDFYDAAVALIGFQRSLAITAHYVLNDQVITQAPALRGARLMVTPPETGSWRVKAKVEPQQPSATSAQSYGAPTEKAINATYDYVVARTLGFPTDFDGTVLPAIQAVRSTGGATSPARLDSVIEKCEVAVRDMHRPIIASRTAEFAKIESSVRSRDAFSFAFSEQTHAYMLQGIPAFRPVEFVGKVSSYNLNTFKGRIFLRDHLRPVPFELRDAARTPRTIAAVAASLSANARFKDSDEGLLRVMAVPHETRTGRLRSLDILAADI